MLQMLSLRHLKPNLKIGIFRLTHFLDITAKSMWMTSMDTYKKTHSRVFVYSDEHNVCPSEVLL